MGVERRPTSGLGVPAFRSVQGGKAALDMSKRHVFNDDDLILHSNSCSMTREGDGPRPTNISYTEARSSFELKLAAMIPGPDMTVQPTPSSTTQNGLADNTTQPKTTTRPDEPPRPHSNPFDLIRDDLGLLASGHGLVLDEGADGQEVQGMRMGGREWERLVGRLKGFLSDSNESEYGLNFTRRRFPRKS